MHLGTAGADEIFEWPDIYFFLPRLAIDGGKTWQNQERLPACSFRTLLSHYLDITTPTSQTLLALLAAHASSEEDKRRLQLLATVFRLLSFLNAALNLIEVVCALF